MGGFKMVSQKLQIIEELNVAEDTMIKAEQFAEVYPYVKDLIEDIIEKIVEVKSIVRGADELMPKGQTKIQDSMIEPELINYNVGSFMGE